MHHQRTELLFLALISIFNFLLPHFNRFVQLAFLSTSWGPEARTGPAPLAGLSSALCSRFLSLEHRSRCCSSQHHQTRGSVRNHVPGPPQPSPWGSHRQRGPQGPLGKDPHPPERPRHRGSKALPLHE